MTLFDETSQGSQEQCDFINYTLEQYGKSLENVVALIADNCETNKALSELCEVPMIGCYSHRLALAVRDYLKPNDHLICKINTMMGKLNYPKLAGQLRQYTSLKPLQFCPTRWLSKMLERYLQIEEYVKIDTLLSYMLSPQENVVIQTLTDSLAPLKSVTIALQRSDIDIAGARLLLDQLLNVKNLDSQGKYITTDCDIAKNPQFESGVIKILNDEEMTMSIGEGLVCPEKSYSRR